MRSSFHILFAAAMVVAVATGCSKKEEPEVKKPAVAQPAVQVAPTDQVQPVVSPRPERHDEPESVRQARLIAEEQATKKEAASQADPLHEYRVALANANTEGASDRVDMTAYSKYYLGEELIANGRVRTKVVVTLNGQRGRVPATFDVTFLNTTNVPVTIEPYSLRGSLMGETVVSPRTIALNAQQELGLDPIQGPVDAYNMKTTFLLRYAYSNRQAAAHGTLRRLKKTEIDLLHRR